MRSATAGFGTIDRVLGQALGDTESAMGCLNHALIIFEGLDDERCVAYTLMCMGSVDAGQLERSQIPAALTARGGVVQA